jgi:hypothetical protein
MNIPTEVVSKIMLFHSSLPFEKEELIYVVEKWRLLKYLLEQHYPSEEDIHMIEEVLENNVIRRLYETNHKKPSRLERMMDDFDD